MPNSFARSLAWLLALAATGCTSLQSAPQPEIGAIPEGYNCFRQQPFPLGAASKDFYCVFALDTASTYYSESSRNDALHNFISKIGETCTIGKTWEMEEPHRTQEHDLALIITAIQCQ